MNQVVLKIAGCALIAAGLVLASNPELVSNKPIPTDGFDAVERRIWWGLLIGFGALPWFHHKLLPWKPTVAATGCALLVGLLVARLIGIALDGSVAKQWLNVGVECVMLAPLLWWYLKIRG